MTSNSGTSSINSVGQQFNDLVQQAGLPARDIQALEQEFSSMLGQQSQGDGASGASSRHHHHHHGDGAADNASGNERMNNHNGCNENGSSGSGFDPSADGSGSWPSSGTSPYDPSLFAPQGQGLGNSFGNSTGSGMPSFDPSLFVPQSNDSLSPDASFGGVAPPAEGMGTGQLDMSNLPASLRPLASDIENAAAASGVNPNLIAAVIMQESGGNVSSTSTNPGNGQTDTGAMQVNPSTFASLQKQFPQQLGGANPNDPAANIMAGALYLGQMLKQFNGNEGLALRAYNSGPDGVDPANANVASNGIGDPNYVTSVNSFLESINGSSSQSL